MSPYIRLRGGNVLRRISLVSPALVCFCLAPLCTYSTAQQAEPVPNPTPSIEVNVNRVLVPVVVRDQQGRAVEDLKKEDFQVFDDGKPRPFTGFLVEKRSAPEATTSANAAGGSPPHPANPMPQSSSLPERITVFLFDDMHLNFEDLAYAQKAATKALDAALEGTDVAAVVSTSGKTNSGLTRDHSKLRDAIIGVRSEGINRFSTADCPYISYYQADLIENQNDSAARSDVTNQVFSCNPSMQRQQDLDVAQRLADGAAMRAVTLGRQDVLATYATTMEIVRRMAPLPGQRTLILVSPGLLPVDQQARTLESQLMDLAAQSNVTISAIDARGLYTASASASDNFHGDAQYQQEIQRSAMRVAENSMGELADGTGGIFIHNSNDLDAGFRKLTEPPHVVYVIELSLNGIKANGSYHRLEVKVDRTGMELEARRGYFMPKPDKHKK